MKLKHVQHRLRQTIQLANLSSCTRRGVGAVAVDKNNITLSEAYNGWIRNSSFNTCGLDSDCKRNDLVSGTQTQIGCIHAEQNLVVNAARTGNSLIDSIVFLSTYPCLMCAKILVQAGVSKVFVLKNSYPITDGIDFLRENAVLVILTEVSNELSQ
jgi:dCMP deaminase